MIFIRQSWYIYTAYGIAALFIFGSLFGLELFLWFAIALSLVSIMLLLALLSKGVRGRVLKNVVNIRVIGICLVVISIFTLRVLGEFCFLLGFCTNTFWFI